MALHYLKEQELSVKRIKKGNGYAFVKDTGTSVSQKDKQRMLSLSIPPGWTNVIISSDEDSHIQAIGTDDRSRKQYIYHPDWTKRKQEHKFDQMINFGEALPTLREVVEAHMREHALTRNRILATIIWLLEHTFIRIGNKVYAEENQSYGLTTMRNKHVDVDGNTVSFSFKGKSGVFHELDITHPRVAKTIKACIELPGYELFQYLNPEGNRQAVDSAEVNDYLQAYAGSDFSAKDFRTWGGSVLAGNSLYRKGHAETKEDFKRNIAEVVKEVSSHLGNTRTICRTYYIHPTILKSYEKKQLIPHFDQAYKHTSDKKHDLTLEEYAAWSLIKNY